MINRIAAIKSNFRCLRPGAREFRESVPKIRENYDLENFDLENYLFSEIWEIKKTSTQFSKKILFKLNTEIKL